MADSGVDAIQAIDPVAGMDIFSMKMQVGDKIALCGNIDCGAVIDNDIEKIIEQRDKLIDHFIGKKGFVLGLSNAVAYETMLASYIQSI